jgi:hypothetical protein
MHQMALTGQPSPTASKPQLSTRPSPLETPTSQIQKIRALKTIQQPFGPTGAFHSCLRTPREWLPLLGSTNGSLELWVVSEDAMPQSQQNP